MNKEVDGTRERVNKGEREREIETERKKRARKQFLIIEKSGSTI